MFGPGRVEHVAGHRVGFGMLVAVIGFGYIVTDAFRAVLLGAAILIGGAPPVRPAAAPRARAATAGPGQGPNPGPRRAGWSRRRHSRRTDRHSRRTGPHRTSPYRNATATAVRAVAAARCRSLAAATAGRAAAVARRHRAAGRRDDHGEWAAGGARDRRRRHRHGPGTARRRRAQAAAGSRTAARDRGRADDARLPRPAGIGPVARPRRNHRRAPRHGFRRDAARMLARRRPVAPPGRTGLAPGLSPRASACRPHVRATWPVHFARSHGPYEPGAAGTAADCRRCRRRRQPRPSSPLGAATFWMIFVVHRRGGGAGADRHG